LSVLYIGILSRQRERGPTVKGPRETIDRQKRLDPGRERTKALTAMASNADSQCLQPNRRPRLGQEPASAEHRGAAPFELLEHPADFRLRARGATLADVFANAARGMIAYLFGDELVEAKPERWERIEITAPDREALLVDWLSELLYRATSGYCAYVGFEVDEIDEQRLAARVGIVSATAIDDIKAVTHHELTVRKCDDGWEATVVFDI
jgi:SHS2 domain-containing protein